MDKEYDVYLVLGSLLISFLTSFLAMVFASFIVWHKKTFSHWWLFGAALNMGLGVWAMHFVGMLALHIETPVAFEIVRTLVSALIAVLASYGALWVILSPDFKHQTSPIIVCHLCTRFRFCLDALFGHGCDADVPENPL